MNARTMMPFVSSRSASAWPTSPSSTSCACSALAKRKGRSTSWNAGSVFATTAFVIRAMSIVPKRTPSTISFSSPSARFGNSETLDAAVGLLLDGVFEGTRADGVGVVGAVRAGPGDAQLDLLRLGRSSQAEHHRTCDQRGTQQRSHVTHGSFLPCPRQHLPIFLVWLRSARRSRDRPSLLCFGVDETVRRLQHGTPRRPTGSAAPRSTAAKRSCTHVPIHDAAQGALSQARLSGKRKPA